ncbi:MAG: diguanylate cyclase, partial [Burkholderiaceae bacterium]
MTDDDLLVFADPEPEVPEPQGDGVWEVLLVDDEPDVHATTLLALKGLTLEGRQLSFTHAHSAAEAQGILRRKADFAVAIVDVVMEHDDAG